MRPSMHYLDALDAMAQQEKRRAQAEPGDETDEGSITEDGGKAKEKKKAAAQNLSVSVRDNQAVGPSGARGKGVVSDSRDALMQAERDAEGERWIDLDWKDERLSF
jgi:DNA-directed RNA polymerase-3 subunit RPC5